jgi:DNA-binding response OmpR family regulator
VRLLLVEDERALAQALDDALREEGWVVDLASDGREGLRMALIGQYDVVVLDIMLPRMSGYTVVKTLRAEQVWVPVLLLTAKDGEYDEADGLDYGADDYLTKPFSFVVLVARLRALLRRDPAPRPAILEAGAVTLDPATHRVEVDGSQVSLAPRELLLLEHLIRAHPAAVRKEDLLEKVWGDLDDANVVEVYIGYLRRKLGRARIETVRGVGYRMTP